MAISYSTLGRLYREKGDEELPQEYFIQAKEHWQELVDNFPAYQEFQNNLAWVKHTLDNLNGDKT